ncbi:MAG: hypothetical protein IIA64_06490, partial [Planctomycetes bacterium]|nr:hypothetical protein [Planctomycetota bacterium]
MAEPDRAEATLSYQRFARGVMEGKISHTALKRALVVVEKDGFTRQDSGEMKRELSDEELAKIQAWVDNGVPEGDPADMPSPLDFPTDQGWVLGQPDLVLRSVDVTVPAVGP